MASDYYIYGLLDPEDMPQDHSRISDLLSSVIYVGKGTADRLNQHARDAQALINEGLEDTLDPVRHRKLTKLVEILKSGQEVPAVKLSAGYSDEEAAYRAECFAIEAVDACRLSSGKEPLTNAVKGHGRAVEDFGVYRDRLNVDRYVSHLDGPAPMIAVKITELELFSSTFDSVPGEESGELPEELSSVADRIVCMTEQSQTEETARPGWSVHNPWDDELARERAHRYWGIGREQVRRYLAGEEPMPTHLLLIIPDDEKRVVRYVWKIDESARWEYYPEYGKWGVPLGERVGDHPLLNKDLFVERADGEVRRAMLHHSSGIRIAHF